MYKRIIAVIALICLLPVMVVSAVGEMPETSSYQYSYWKEAVAAPESYIVSEVIDSESLGVAISKISDIFCDDAGRLYITDSGLSRLICADSGRDTVSVVDRFEYNGEIQSFNSPEGVFVNSKGNIFVADTGNARVVVFDSALKCTRIIGEPSEEAVLSYEYTPSKLCADADGRIYVISKNETQGILQFSASGEFIGYLGATRVVPNLTEIFYRMFATRTQLKSMLRSIPTEYNNLTIDSDGFVYGTVSSLNPYTVLSDIASNGSSAAPIRKLNAGGDDILVRNGNYPPVGDLVFNVANGTEANYDGPSALVDVTAMNDGIYSVLDSNRGRIFTYNESGELLYIFGSRGSGEGQFTSPCAICCSGTDLLVADSDRNDIQVFKPTDYALKILNAISFYQAGEYEKEQEIWREVLNEYGGSDMAYTGIGKSYYNQQDYKTAMEYFRKGNNRTYYSKAFYEQRKITGRLVAPYVLAVIALAAAACVCIKVLRKKGILVKAAAASGGTPTKTREFLQGIRFGFHICCHPFSGFWDMKYEKKGNIYSATAILLMTVAVNVITTRFTPYMFNDIRPSDNNILLTSLASVICPLALWCVSNWCFTTLMDGKVTAKDIYMFSCYSLFPILIIHIPLFAASFIMSLEEAAFYNALMTVSVLWLVFMFFCGTLVIHHYSAGKTVLAIFLTIIGIAVIVFLALLCVTLVQQIVIFIKVLISEISLRL